MLSRTGNEETSHGRVAPLFVTHPNLDADVSARKLVARFDRASRKEEVMASLTVDHITKSFGHFQAITDLSMEVQEGTIFGFLGANGAGKTTTMRMILDILRPDRGRVTWNGQDVREVPRRRSEEHTSELQSHSDLVCRLLLEKTKQPDARCRESTRIVRSW